MLIWLTLRCCGDLWLSEVKVSFTVISALLLIDLVHLQFEQLRIEKANLRLQKGNLLIAFTERCFGKLGLEFLKNSLNEIQYFSNNTAPLAV